MEKTKARKDPRDAHRTSQNLQREKKKNRTPNGESKRRKLERLDSEAPLEPRAETNR